MSGQMLGMKNKIAVANTQNRVAEAMGAAGNAMQMANAQLNNQKFNEAMKIAKVCDEKLKNAESKVNKILNPDGSLEDFEIEE